MRAWALALLFVPGVASAQVNTEKLRSWDKEGFGGAVDFAMYLRKGNVDLLTISSGMRLQYVTLHPAETATSTNAEPPPRELKDLVLAIGSLNFGRRVLDPYINNGFAHLRWTRMWIPDLGSEVFAQAQYNEFLRVKQRLLLGVGARADVFETSWGEITLGTAPMLEIEDLNDNLGVAEPHTEVVRWSNYLSLKLYMTDPDITIVNTLYVQPRFDEFSDYRFLSEGEISVAVVPDILAFVTSVSIMYDSRPAPTVKRLDTIISNSIRVTF
ncbi:MAG: DUF481 domain-containing protein [Deltaproteobacteria bacterium]|jgi:hypothetical protein